MASDSNRDVAYLELGGVEVQKIDFPTFRNPAGKTVDHGIIFKVATTNISGYDRHMVRGRTPAPAGIAVAVAVFGALSLLIVDHGLWNRPYVESSRAHAATEAAVKADGALITPTRNGPRQHP
jgi:hypothetical protein